MKKSLAEQIAELSLPAPRDFDPEALTRDHNDSDADSGDDALATAHYVPMGKSQLRAVREEPVLDDAKYRGQRASRKDLVSEDDEDEEEEEEEEHEASDVENDDANANEDSDVSDEEDDDDASGESATSVSEDDVEDATTTPRTSALQHQLAELTADDRQMMKVVTANASMDVEKGKHVRNQLAFYDGLLDVRIRAQRCLNLANSMPDHQLLPLFLDARADPDGKAHAERDAVKESLLTLMSNIVDLKRELVRNSREVYESGSVGNAQENAALDGATLPKDPVKLWKSLQAFDTSILHPFRDRTVEKWNKKVQIASAGNLLRNKSLKAVNQSVTTQVRQLMMADMERLRKRTQVVRGSSKALGAELMRKRKRDGEDREDGDEQSNASPVATNEEIFDDNDYYSTILRELIDSKITDSDDPLMLGQHWAKMKELQRKNRKHRENCDRKASKGRRLRYDVHEKLANYMVPIEKATWHEEMTEELFRTLRRNNAIAARRSSSRQPHPHTHNEQQPKMKLPTKCPTDQDPLVYGLLYGINLATKNGPLPPLDGSTLPPDTGSATSTAPPRLGKTDSAMSGKDFQPTLTLERKRPVSAEPSLSKIATKVLGPKPFAWRSDRPYLQAEKFEVISHPEFPAAVVGGKRAKRACIEFKSYFPSLFQHVRATTPIGTRNPLVADPEAAYRASFTHGGHMISYGSLANSGARFYYTNDKRYIVKTIPQFQMKFLQTVLPQYTEYVANNPNTLLVRIQGFYRIKWRRQTRNGFHSQEHVEYLMVMSNSLSYKTGFSAISSGNMMDADGDGGQATEITFDMKAWGLKHMRDTKDLREFISTERKVNMPAADKAAVMEQAKRDSEFLATIGVNDYSLLLGILRKRGTGLAAATPSSSNPSTTAVFAKSEVGLERAAPSMKASNDNVAATADDGADNAASVAITEKDPTTVAGSAIGIHMESLTATPAQSATRNPSNASEIGIATRNPPAMSIVTAETNRRSSNNSVTDVEMRHPYVHKSEDGNELYFLSLIDILSDFEWNRELGHYLLPRLWQWFPRYIQPAEYARRIQQTLARVLQ